jgi:hypothetical protein
MSVCEAAAAFICAECIAEILGFAIARPVAAIALARPVGLRVVLLLNRRFLSSLPGDLDAVDMIEAVSSSPPFFGESIPVKPPPVDCAEVDAALFL